MLKRLAAIAALFASPAFAQDEHAQFHHFYQHMLQPGTGMSCCSGHDCKPAISARSTPEGVEINVGGHWIAVPMSKVIETDTPDQGPHWCGVNANSTLPITYCVIIPRGNT